MLNFYGPFSSLATRFSGFDTGFRPVSQSGGSAAILFVALVCACWRGYCSGPVLLGRAGGLDGGRKKLGGPAPGFEGGRWAAVRKSVRARAGPSFLAGPGSPVLRVSYEPAGEEKHGVLEKSFPLGHRLLVGARATDWISPRIWATFGRRPFWAAGSWGTSVCVRNGSVSFGGCRSLQLLCYRNRRPFACCWPHCGGQERRGIGPPVAWAKPLLHVKGAGGQVLRDVVVGTPANIALPLPGKVRIAQCAISDHQGFGQPKRLLRKTGSSGPST